MSRRLVLGGMTSALLSACSARGSLAPRPALVSTKGQTALVDDPGIEPSEIYAAQWDGGIELPAVNTSKIDPQFYRRIVDAPSGFVPGTLIVRLAECHLYLILDEQRAMRYGIGVGKAGYAWSGRGVIGRTQVWPSWTPTPQMLVRYPDLVPHKKGMAGGLENPLGARALYIFNHGQDTLYRVHGTPEWWSIGRAVSSGCIRMLNQDVVDLYARVRVGSAIIVG